MQYIRMFEDLSTKVSELTDMQLEGIFMNSLKPVMREVENMSKHVDLLEMITTAYQMEDNILYKMVCREREREVRKGGQERDRRLQNHLFHPQAILSGSQSNNRIRLGVIKTKEVVESRDLRLRKRNV